MIHLYSVESIREYMGDINKPERIKQWEDHQTNDSKNSHTPHGAT